MGRQYLFGKPKRNKKGAILIAAAFIFIAGFGMWMNAPSEESAGEKPRENWNSPHDITVSQRKNTEGEDPKQKTPQSYSYLLKEEDGRVALYRTFEGKEPEFVRSTEIPFSLISFADQQSFRKGIPIENEEALDQLLQDFES